VRTIRERYTRKEWITLLAAPIIVNNSTAKIDGPVEDEHEQMAFVRVVTENAAGSEDGLTREVCQELSIDLAGVLSRMREVAVGHSDGELIAEAARLAKRTVPRGAPVPYKQFLFELGKATADTSDPPPAPGTSAAWSREPYRDKGSVKKLAALPELRWLLGLPE
jgi:hypothetical protein